MSKLQALTTLAYHAERALQSSGFDVRSYVKDFDFGTLGLLAVVAVVTILLFEALVKTFPAYFGGATFGRSLLASSVEAYPGFRVIDVDDPRRQSRSIETLTPVLDALHSAALLWENN
ncbi:uncharacterized protein LOC143041686 [Oratosquilla oratoria]|uniref:uncharacterized protein LOC143041686 n=1 Tax=Oratosquilla oratoria TaxID=337810 RepID=UPI003F76803D